MTNQVFVNRTLNLKKIKYIGFDMDHTLIRYNSQAFEELVHSVVIKKLIKDHNYPEIISKLPFEFKKVVRGLVIDRRNGNLLKLNRYSGIRVSYHGTKKIDFQMQKKIYKSIYIDLGDTNYLAIDTAFSLSLGLLFSQLVDLKDSTPKFNLPSYDQISKDVEECVDDAHRDGSLKDEVKKNVAKYIIVKDPEVIRGLEWFKRHDKKLFILTNSHFPYMKMLLDQCINPFLKEHKNWEELFEIVICAARKPRFFYDQQSFLKVDPKDGTMSDFDSPLKAGVYQGGCASIFTTSLGLSGEDILYIGDHIYGDILRLKKDCNWRTALVVEELEDEILALKKTKPIDDKINLLMAKKKPLEDQLLEMSTLEKDISTRFNKRDDEKAQELQEKVSVIDKEISSLIDKHQNLFNEYWGEIMRVGAEESYFAYQVERYACIYMAKIRDLLECSPRTYFRGYRRTLPHEVL